MDYKTKSVELLNAGIAGELTSLHQYMYFHFRLEDLGYETLARMFHKLAIVEMQHVEMMAERILFLGGDVEMKMATPVKQIHEVDQMLAYSTQLETGTVADYNKYAAQCGANGDSATKKLFETLVVVEEEHEDVFDTEHNSLQRLGDRYLALQAYSHTQEAAADDKN